MQAHMMELIFETSGAGDGEGNQFTMKVSQSESIPEIKEKIQELKRIPISRQTLSFNGAILTDDFNFRYSNIVDGATIHLHHQMDVEHPSQEDEDQLPLDNVLFNDLLNDPLRLPPNFDRIRIELHTNIISDDTAGEWQIERSKIHRRIELPEPSVEMCGAGGVRSKRVRENTSEANGTPADNTTHSDADNGNGEDRPPSTGNRPLTAYETIRAHDIRPQVRLPGPPPNTLMVVVIYGGQQTTVTVRPREPVSPLRGRLQQIQWRLPLRYDFIHDRRVMNETRSFAYHQVLRGDVIRPAPRLP